MCSSSAGSRCWQAQHTLPAVQASVGSGSFPEAAGAFSPPPYFILPGPVSSPPRRVISLRKIRSCQAPIQKRSKGLILFRTEIKLGPCLLLLFYLLLSLSQRNWHSIIPIRVLSLHLRAFAPAGCLPGTLFPGPGTAYSLRAPSERPRHIPSSILPQPGTHHSQLLRLSLLNLMSGDIPSILFTCLVSHCWSLLPACELLVSGTPWCIPCSVPRAWRTISAPGTRVGRPERGRKGGRDGGRKEERTYFCIRCEGNHHLQ